MTVEKTKFNPDESINNIAGQLEEELESYNRSIGVIKVMAKYIIREKMRLDHLLAIHPNVAQRTYYQDLITRTNRTIKVIKDRKDV